MSRTAQEGLYTVRDHYLWVMAHNAPDLKALTTGMVGQRWRRLPMKERLRCAVRLMLPQKIAQKLAGRGA